MGAAEFSGVLIGTKSLFCFRSTGCQFESYAAHRTPPLSALCCKKQQQKTPRAQQYTSSLVIPCAHGKLNVKAPPDKPKTGDTYEYHSIDYTCMCIQARPFAQTRDIWRNRASMG